MTAGGRRGHQFADEGPRALAIPQPLIAGRPLCIQRCRPESLFEVAVCLDDLGNGRCCCRCLIKVPMRLVQLGLGCLEGIAGFPTQQCELLVEVADGGCNPLFEVWPP